MYIPINIKSALAVALFVSLTACGGGGSDAIDDTIDAVDDAIDDVPEIDTPLDGPGDGPDQFLGNFSTGCLDRGPAAGSFLSELSITSDTLTLIDSTFIEDRTCSTAFSVIEDINSIEFTGETTETSKGTAFNIDLIDDQGGETFDIIYYDGFELRFGEEVGFEPEDRPTEISFDGGSIYSRL